MRRCNTTLDDCAIFLEHNSTLYSNRGYTTVIPAGTSDTIEYAYHIGDADGDGLPTNFERIIGTGINNPDTDGDSFSDGLEFPMARLPRGDPLIKSEVVFKDSFEDVPPDQL